MLRFIRIILILIIALAGLIWYETLKGEIQLNSYLIGEQEKLKIEIKTLKKCN